MSLLICFAFGEIGLRVFHPKYQSAAESAFDTSSQRIWARKSETRSEWRHPDSGQPHVIYYNNLALRQNRRFEPSEIKSATANVGFFGDSFTENTTLPAPYSFTEPLDYLLNTRLAGINVLNFGVDGYGPDQSFIYYRDFEYARNLTYVFYVFCVNDLRNIYENGLFALENGELIQREIQPAHWWVKMLRGFHTTYLFIDVLNRLRVSFSAFTDKMYADYHMKRAQQTRWHDMRADSIEAALVDGRDTGDLAESAAVFEAVLSAWKEEVESNGGEFVVVLLPRLEEHAARPLFPDKYVVIDLYELATRDITAYDFKNFRFHNNGHWNESGNHLAASYLYRFLERELDLAPMAVEQLVAAFQTYYMSFGGWAPDDDSYGSLVTTETDRAGIRERYEGVGR